MGTKEDVKERRELYKIERKPRKEVCTRSKILKLNSFEKRGKQGANRRREINK